MLGLDSAGKTSEYIIITNMLGTFTNDISYPLQTETEQDVSLTSI